MTGASRQSLTSSIFDAPEPAFFYDGTVMHQRLMPFRHRFAYRVWALMADIDRLAELPQRSRLIGYNRFNLLSFHDRDHGSGGRVGLRQHVDRLLAEAGVAPAARVFLMCYPRVLGYTFNPIAVYYCFAGDGGLLAMIYEVRNTFGEHHTYVAPLNAGERDDRQEREKLFFVSPFLGFGLTYRFRFDVPAERLRLRILEVGEDGPVLAASFHGQRLAITSRQILRLCLAVPLLGMKVMAGIHWEALRLWLKGARLVPRPVPPPPASLAHPLRFFNPDQPSPRTPSK